MRTMKSTARRGAHSPDTADLDLAIDTQAKTPRKPPAATPRWPESDRRAQGQLGDKGKITTGYALNPEYDQRRPRSPPYRIHAQNTVTVNTGALD